MENEHKVAKDVELVVWREMGGTLRPLTSVIADGTAWEKYVKADAKSVGFKTATGRPVWEVFHLDDGTGTAATPVGSFIFNAPEHWVSLRTQKSLSKERLPIENERRRFAKVTMLSSEDVGTLE